MLLKRDESLGPNRHNRLKSPFPAGNEGDCDVMVLIERREMIEVFIQDVVNKIDFEVYEPLGDFICAKENMKRLLLKVVIIKRVFRRFIAKKKLNLRLFKFYSKELIKYMYAMESGIAVHDATCNNIITINNMSSPVEYVLWLDVCEEMALSRLCLATREIFELPAADYEDERLANGTYELFNS
jgi:hypothetical protein